MIGNNWLVDRAAIESGIDRKLTEEQWVEITEELAGRVDNFIDEIIDEIIDSTLEGEAL